MDDIYDKFAKFIWRLGYRYYLTVRGIRSDIYILYRKIFIEKTIPAKRFKG